MSHRRLLTLMLLLATGTAVAVFLIVSGGGDTTGEGSATKAQSASAQQRPAHVSPTSEWPVFGRVVERTHYLADAPNPPFHFNWQFFAHQLLEFPPALADGELYVINKTGKVYAVDARTGKVTWQRDLGNDVTGPAYGDGRLYAGQLDGDFVALDGPSGKPSWSFSAHSKVESSPLVAEGRVYFGDDDGTLWALDDTTGKLAWKADLGAPVKASPSFHDGTVYVGDYEGTLHALDAANGHERWDVDTTEVPPGGDGGFYSSPAIAFGRVFEARDDGTVFAVTLAGKPDWHFATSDAIYGSPAVADVKGLGPALYIGSYNHNLYALDATSGHKHWSYDVGGEIPGSPTIVGDTVFTSSFETKRTTGLDASTGKPVFRWGSAGYDPMISDGRQVFLTGFQTVWAFSGKG